MGPNLMRLCVLSFRQKPNQCCMMWGVIKRVKTRRVPGLRQHILLLAHFSCVPSRRRCCTVNLGAIERAKTARA